MDTDGCVSAETYCSNIITSVNKVMDVAVRDTIKAAKDGSFSNEPYVGTLENDGTGWRRSTNSSPRFPPS